MPSEPPEAFPRPVPTAVVERSQHWFDQSWWDQEVLSVVATSPASLCNLRVTLAHYELSLALAAILGPGPGANFHTWAVWGSKKAGAAVREEDIPNLRLYATLFGGAIGLVGAGVASRSSPIPPGIVRSYAGLTRRVRSAATIAVCTGSAYGATSWRLDRASRNILHGNIMVLEDIGTATAKFVCLFHDRPTPDPERWDAFLSSLRSGPTLAGGQDLLKSGFTQYYRAKDEADPNAKHELMLLGNLYIILHEHLRLDPYIDRAMWSPTRRLVTSRLLDYKLGTTRLRVGEDVPAWDGPGPTTLQHLENPDLIRFLSGPDGWDQTPDSLVGSHAKDWSDLRARMNYISDLFRSRHFDPGLFSAPFVDKNCATIWAGSVPGGPL